MVNSPGRSSGSWFTLLPAPSHLKTLLVNRYSLLARTYLAFNVSRFTFNVFNRQWHSRVSSPFTAAGPRGICTLFPYPGVTMWRAL